MNSLVIVTISLVLLYIGYRFYGNVIVKLWDMDLDAQTPAHEFNDGIDYVPAKHWTLLFGHHFASIAGAGPIIGPVIACLYWGWLGVVLWLVFGSVLLGAVHDFSALITSIKLKGCSVGHVCGDLIGQKANMLFSIFLWLALVLVVAVFAAVGAMTLTSKPEVVIPAIGIIPVAVFIGILLYRTKLPQYLISILGIFILIILIIAGKRFPILLPAFLGNPQTAWIAILMIYAFIASILPVNILLQPRDYLSTFLLFFGLGAGYLGILISHPEMTAPAINHGSSAGPIWPLMFVIVACGAISGFHSIVSSGTTSKQLSSLHDAKKIGYGAMIVESVLGIMALITVGAGLSWTSSQGPLVFSELMKKGWIVAFSEGYGQLTKPFFGSLGVIIAATMVNSFIITTLDTATRINRYLTEELFNIKNKYISTLFVILPAFYLALGNWKKIWPVFGASNQLVAALTLLVISAYLLSKGKKIVYTVIPAVFMLLTSGAALIWQLTDYLASANYVLAVIDVLLLSLALYMCFISMKYFLSTSRKRA